MDTLDYVIDDTNAHRATEANAIHGLIDQTFVVVLVIMKNILQITKTLSDQLQSSTLELASAVDLIHSVISHLETNRDENKWD
jgi:sensor histidine kinase regulating citrate/malate metabolism